ncbi:hypothetical protein EXU85_20230 [Spirosoma sp. KCTC 42546]|uniref:phage tail protein n=1 Tax=Spirosoma sp. KCTC 42546 TaxID=2520506 RepID=UPI00115A7DE4|nr:phage tail protein [Spirosoma sp. KCTC 42546]QDK80807.1 hypothetical protein EXU85_20230 [Spirosoma sp. KCTC 42546]
MVPIVLIKPGGPQYPLISLSPLRGIAKGEQKIELLNVDTVNLTATSNAPISISIGDTVAVYGQLYTVNQLPAWKRLGEDQFEYDLSLEGPQYHLLRVIFFDTAVNGNGLSSSFSLTGNLQFFATILMSNLARVFGGAWGLGTVQVPGEVDENGTVGTPIDGDDTVTKNLTFENENCLSVLQRLCTEWGTEFSIEYRPNDAPNRVLHIKPAGQVLDFTVQYGQGKGLYELSRRSVSQTPFVTRAYIFGSSKNLPSGYRGFATRLQLPFAGSGTSSLNDSYIQNLDAVNAFGLIEGTQVFEEIYPHRTGTVGAATGQLTFTDPSIPFNPHAIDRYDVVNSQQIPHYQYLVPGLSVKVHFQTGSLAGYDFELVKFDAGTKTFTIKSFTDERGQVFPDPVESSPFRIAAGDTYVLTDIIMPNEYVQAAEAQLLAAGMQWLRENSTPSVEYSLTIDEMYLQKLAGDTGPVPIDNPPSFFAVGDQIRLVDTELAIDRYIRIIGFTRDVIRPYKYTLTLGDAPKVPLLARILAHQKDVVKVLNGNGLTDPVAAKPLTPEQIKAQLDQSIKNQLRPLAHATNYTLGIQPLPPGYTALINDQLVRHKLEVNVFQGTPDNLKQQLIAKLQAVGHKILL